MGTFTFKVLGEGDRVLEGTIRAASLYIARRKLEMDFGRVLSVEEQEQEDEDAIPLLPTLGISTESIAIYTRQLSVLLRSGISLPRALEIVSQGEDDRLNTVFVSTAGDVERGKTLSRSMRRFPYAFSALYLSMIEAAEVSGNLDANLDKLCEVLERTVRLQKRVQAAFVYPAAISVVALGVLGIFVYAVLPMVIPIFHGIGIELPLVTRSVLFFAALARNPFVVLLVGMIFLASLWLAWSYSRTREGRRVVDGLMLTVPLFGDLFRKIAVARVLFTLAILMESGISLGPALRVAERAAGNFIVERGLFRAQKLVMEGESVGDALLEIGIFPYGVIKLLMAGEEAGQLPKMMMRASVMYEEEADLALSTLATLLEPLALVVVGGIVAFITVAAFMPTILLMRAL